MVKTKIWLVLLVEKTARFHCAQIKNNVHSLTNFSRFLQIPPSRAIVLIIIILKVDFICSRASIIRKSLLNNSSSYMHIIFHYYAISILGNSISRAHTYIIMIFTMFACWFQPGLFNQPTVFSSHKKPAPAPTSEHAEKTLLLYHCADSHWLSDVSATTS